jgi:hypothetical protein
VSVVAIDFTLSDSRQARLAPPMVGNDPGE